MQLKQKAKFMGAAILLLPFALFGQTVSIERQVVAATGNHGEGLADFNVTYTVGEMAVATMGQGQYVLTQGFNQPDGELLPALGLGLNITESQCPGFKDGVIEVNPTGCLPPYTIEFAGKGDTTMITNVTSSYTFSGLDSGNYHVTVRGMTLCTELQNIQVNLKNNTCDVNFYTGITPNGDGRNDTWIIDNIEINQPNEVKIFNRWGNLVWSTSDYNNTNRSWDGMNNNGNPLPGGTYFYTIEVPGNSSASKGGWIQLLR